MLLLRATSCQLARMLVFMGLPALASHDLHPVDDGGGGGGFELAIKGKVLKVRLSVIGQGEVAEIAGGVADVREVADVARSVGRLALLEDCCEDDPHAPDCRPDVVVGFNAGLAAIAGNVSPSL